jgi:endonuclease/exonuclease/phosphatase (EEP) superfamily protein YafD
MNTTMNQPPTSQQATSSSGLLSLARSITAAGVVVGCLPLLARWWWLADLAANLRTQLLVGLMTLATIVAFIARRRLAMVLFAMLVLNAIAILPAFLSYAVNSPVPLAGNATVAQPASISFRVCSNNVYISNPNHDRIIASIDEAAADVLAIVELSNALADRIQDHMGDTHPVFVSGINDDGTFGIGLWSKHPVEHSEVFYLCEPLVPSIEADININGRQVRVIATHPIPPVSNRAFAARNLHLTMLAERVQMFRDLNPQTPVILVGDLNLTPWSPHFDRLLSQSGLQSTAAGRGLQPTWYRWRSPLFGLIIDHGLCTPDVHCTGRRILGDTGSDHRPVVFDFRM